MNRRIKPEIIQRLVLLVVLALVAAALSVLTDRFFTVENLQNVGRQVAAVIITGSAVTLVMISGNIDLSVGSVVAMSGVLFAKFSQWDVPLVAAALMAVAIGGVCGLVNGLLVEDLKIPAMITTLGTMYVARGLAFISCDGNTINTGLSPNFTFFGRGFIGGVPFPLLLTLVVLVAFVFLQLRTKLGRYTFAVGENRGAAFLSGIDAGSLVKILYVLAGACAAFSGVIMSSRLGCGKPNIGEGFEMDVIVAVLLGGTSLLGGEGSVVGMAIGAIIVGVLANGLNLLGINTFYQDVIKGIVMIAAVLLDTSLKNALARIPAYRREEKAGVGGAE